MLMVFKFRDQNRNFLFVMKLGRVSLYLLGVMILTSGVLWYIGTVKKVNGKDALLKYLF